MHVPPHEESGDEASGLADPRALNTTRHKTRGEESHDTCQTRVIEPGGTRVKKLPPLTACVAPALTGGEDLDDLLLNLENLDTVKEPLPAISSKPLKRRGGESWNLLLGGQQALGPSRRLAKLGHHLRGQQKARIEDPIDQQEARSESAEKVKQALQKRQSLLLDRQMRILRRYTNFEKRREEQARDQQSHLDQIVVETEQKQMLACMQRDAQLQKRRHALAVRRRRAEARRNQLMIDKLLNECTQPADSSIPAPENKTGTGSQTETELKLHETHGEKLPGVGTNNSNLWRRILSKILPCIPSNGNSSCMERKKCKIAPEQKLESRTQQMEEFDAHNTEIEGRLPCKSEFGSRTRARHEISLSAPAESATKPRPRTRIVRASQSAKDWCDMESELSDDEWLEMILKEEES